MSDFSRMLEETRAGLQSIYGQRLCEVVLYGSCARGDNDEESDVDFAVVLDMPRADISRFRNEVVALASAMTMKYDRLASIIEIPQSDYDAYRDALPFYRNIAREGVTLNAG